MTKIKIHHSRKKQVHTPKHCQSTTTAHLETQYADYKKKSIHEKASLLNSKLACVKKFSDDIKDQVGRFCLF